jgi:hypothetical protein
MNLGRLPSFAHVRAFPLPIRLQWIENAAMTRPAIERCIWIFIVALFATFVWTVCEVLKMVGWF